MDHVQHCLRLLGSTTELRALWESVPSGSIRTMEGLNSVISSNNFVTNKFAKSIIKHLTMMESALKMSSDSVNMQLATVSRKGINLHELVNLGLHTAIKKQNTTTVAKFIRSLELGRSKLL